MEDTIVNEVVGKLEELESESEHHVTILEGIGDTITGNESMDLTAAQHYLHGVMYANGVAPLNRAGNEGLFSKIRAFIQTGIMFVKEFLHKVWKFFFGDEFTRAGKALKKKIATQVSNLNALPMSRELKQECVKQIEEILESAGKKALEVHEEIGHIITDTPHEERHVNAELWASMSASEAKIKDVIHEKLTDMPYNTVRDAIKFLNESTYAASKLSDELSSGKTMSRIIEQALKIMETSIKGEEDPEKLEAGRNAVKLGKMGVRMMKVMMTSMKHQFQAIDKITGILSPQHFP